jgi:hypothetical protein
MPRAIIKIENTTPLLNAIHGKILGKSSTVPTITKIIPVPLFSEFARISTPTIIRIVGNEKMICGILK